MKTSQWALKEGFPNLGVHLALCKREDGSCTCNPCQYQTSNSLAGQEGRRPLSPFSVVLKEQFMPSSK